jgi:hypothetical protein
MGGGGISTVGSEVIFASPMKGMNDTFSELLAHGQNSWMFLRSQFSPALADNKDGCDLLFNLKTA